MGDFIENISELIPIYGTYQVGKRFINNPSWKGAGELALSAAGDAAMLTGIGAGVGAALKAGNAAAKAGKIAKTANSLRKVGAARELKFRKPIGKSYYDVAGEQYNNIMNNALISKQPISEKVYQTAMSNFDKAGYADVAVGHLNNAKTLFELGAQGNGAARSLQYQIGKYYKNGGTLISRNPVQKFKQGRKIIKAEDGWRLLNGRAVQRNVNNAYAARQAGDKKLTHRYIFAGKQYGSFDGGKTYYGLDDGGRPLSYKANQQLLAAIGRRNKPKVVDKSKNSSIDFLNSDQNQRLLETMSSSGSSTTIKPKSRSGWSYGFDRSKEGIGDIATMQRKLKAEGYYADDENSTDDGKWGQSTENAYKRYLAKQKAMELPQEVVKPVVPAITVQTPNFGYRTSNTYQDADFYDRLKAMGIRSNADLINFMYKTNGADYNWNGDTWAKQFRSDVNRALGGDYSDINIRNIFNTSGNWGRGFLGRGDLGDFQNALQINAGIWNGRYDNAKSAYETKKPNYIDFINKVTQQYVPSSEVSYAKKGGNLIPLKNPIQRFKQKNFR